MYIKIEIWCKGIQILSFISKDGYIRTYFKPNDGINYYNRQ